MDTVIAFYFLLAALWAVSGADAQARLARARMLADENPAVARLAQLWTPNKLLASSGVRRERKQEEARLREDEPEWQRYESIRQELRAWNALESSIALAAAGALFVALRSVFS